MRMLRYPRGFAVVVMMLAVPVAVQAQSGNPAPATSGTDRLFLAFVEDAAVVGNQWWEGQLEFTDGEAVDLLLARGVVAVQPWDNVELGARIGFGNSDTPAGVADGTGATDLDAWGKYYLGKSDELTEFAVGGLLTVPTGDDGAGLGTDAFSVAAFGAMRHRFPRAILSIHAGLRFNGDGNIFSGASMIDLDGKTSPSFGVGLIYPRSDQVSFVGEAQFEGERFEGGDSDLRILGGVNWRVRNRGAVRGALAIGLTDGAPDAQFIAGYVFSF
jgi:hypothetical protein